MNHYVKTTKKALWTTTASGRRQVAKETERALQRKKARQIASKKQRKPIPRRSKAMTMKMAAYNKLRSVFLARFPWCQNCYQEKATDVHHAKGRGKFLFYTPTWFALCRKCHDFVHQNPSWSKANGLMLPRTERIQYLPT